MMPWTRLRRQPTSDEVCEVAWCRLIYFSDAPKPTIAAAMHVVINTIEACLRGEQI